jgi:hypothetical protein
MLIPITAIVIFSSLIARWSMIAAFQRMLLQFAACFGRLQDAAAAPRHGQPAWDAGKRITAWHGMGAEFVQATIAAAFK